eukprot:gene8585-34024_t
MVQKILEWDPPASSGGVALTAKTFKPEKQKPAPRAPAGRNRAGGAGGVGANSRAAAPGGAAPALIANDLPVNRALDDLIEKKKTATRRPRTGLSPWKPVSSKVICQQ